MDIPKLNITLDLDETLIHCVIGRNEEHVKQLESMEYFLTTMMSHDIALCIFYRPGLWEFLDKINNKYNLYICTFATKDYCDILIREFIKKVKGLKFIESLSRSLDGLTIYKALSAFPLDKNTTLIIDDRVDVWPFDRGNLLQIKPYRGPDVLNYVADDEFTTILEYINRVELKVKEQFYSKKKINVQAEMLSIISDIAAEVYLPVQAWSSWSEISLNDIPPDYEGYSDAFSSDDEVEEDIKSTYVISQPLLIPKKGQKN
jgi:TFIIF-interacting CTD phosphatase-like protein